jgi:hypothetical protein
MITRQIPVASHFIFTRYARSYIFCPQQQGRVMDTIAMTSSGPEKEASCSACHSTVEEQDPACACSGESPEKRKVRSRNLFFHFPASTKIEAQHGGSLAEHGCCMRATAFSGFRMRSRETADAKGTKPTIEPMKLV